MADAGRKIMVGAKDIGKEPIVFCRALLSKRIEIADSSVVGVSLFSHSAWVPWP